MRFRFAIRDMMWLTVVAALVCGWSITARRESARHRREEDEARLYWAKAQADADMGLVRQEALGAQWASMERNLRDIEARLRKIEKSNQPSLDSVGDSPN